MSEKILDAMSDSSTSLHKLLSRGTKEHFSFSLDSELDELSLQNNPHIETTKSSGHESVLMGSKSELKRIQDFLDEYQDKTPFLQKLVINSGVHKYYKDKFRKLMFDIGTSNHPYPEENL